MAAQFEEQDEDEISCTESVSDDTSNHLLFVFWKLPDAKRTPARMRLRRSIVFPRTSHTHHHQESCTRMVTVKAKQQVGNLRYKRKKVVTEWCVSCTNRPGCVFEGFAYRH